MVAKWIKIYTTSCMDMPTTNVGERWWGQLIGWLGADGKSIMSRRKKRFRFLWNQSMFGIWAAYISFSPLLCVCGGRWKINIKNEMLSAYNFKAIRFCESLDDNIYAYICVRKENDIHWPHRFTFDFQDDTRVYMRCLCIRNLFEYFFFLYVFWLRITYSKVIDTNALVGGGVGTVRCHNKNMFTRKLPVSGACCYIFVFVVRIFFSVNIITR